MTTQQIHYRPDIDGLRAVAILLVVLYHLKIPGFSGGFVGVDIFFAISGFLIFSILNREYETSGRVDWLAFYARRIRRLLPEATIMIVTVMVLGFFVLLPLGEQQSLAKSGIAGSLWLANIYFSSFGGDYFSPSVERQPLLHLWSLGVEEQFYLTVPVMFLFAGVLCRRLGLTWRRSVLVLLGASGLLSLGIAAWGANAYPVAAYYLLPTRAYEFAIGALAALWLDHSRQVGMHLYKIRAATLLGLAGIVLSLATASQVQAFPGAWALLPTVSAALLLWSCGLAGPNSARSFLDLRPVAYLGKISYGWYLWHFPLLILWREYSPFDTSILGEVVIAIAALAPAVAGYTLVAILRKKNNVVDTARRTTEILRYGMFVAVATVLVSGGLGAHAKFIGSQSPDLAFLKSQLEDWYSAPNGCFDPLAVASAPLPECVFGDPDGSVTLVLWGDSHANHWVPALESTFRKLRIRGIERVRAACPPALHESNLLNQGQFVECKQFGEDVLRDLVQRQRSGPVGVILAARWALYVNDEPLSRVDRIQSPLQSVPGGPAIAESLKAVTNKLVSLRIPIGILLQVPEQKFVVPSCVRRWSVDLCETPWLQEEVYLRTPKTIISEVAALSNALVLDPAPYLCREDKCRILEGNVLLYNDDDHLSKKGAQSLSWFLSDFVASLRASVLTVSPN